MAAVVFRSLVAGPSAVRVQGLRGAVRCSRHLSLSWRRQQDDVTHTGQVELRGQYCFLFPKPHSLRTVI